jgi:hypothetical protein
LRNLTGAKSQVNQATGDGVVPTACRGVAIESAKQATHFVVGEDLRKRYQPANSRTRNGEDQRLITLTAKAKKAEVAA